MLVWSAQGASSTETDCTNAQFYCRCHSPRGCNGYGYFTGFALRTNIVEKYVLFSAVLHVAVALTRTRVDLRSAGRS